MPQASTPAPGGPQHAPPPATRDRVTLVVRLTLALLLVIGVLSIFGDSLLGTGGDPPTGSTGPASQPEPPGP